MWPTVYGPVEFHVRLIQRISRIRLRSLGDMYTTDWQRSTAASELCPCKFKSDRKGPVQKRFSCAVQFRVRRMDRRPLAGRCCSALACAAALLSGCAASRVYRELPASALDLPPTSLSERISDQTPAISRGLLQDQSGLEYVWHS